MGVVYKARRADGSFVAVKVLASELAENAVLKQRFYQEARIAMGLDHPNLVRALDVGEDTGRHYLVMEFVEGESLSRLVKRMGRLRESDALRVIVAVARGLDKAHRQQLVHRDVKPDNILLTTDGQAKLADLGLAKALDAEMNLTQVDRGLGTPNWMSPEQFKDARHVDVRCDVYALGETLYFMLTGKMPFVGDGLLDTFQRKIEMRYTPPEEIEPTLRPATLRAVRRAMEAVPERRPATVREFIRILRNLSKDAGDPGPMSGQTLSRPSIVIDLPPRSEPGERARAVRREPKEREPCSAIATELSEARVFWFEDAAPYLALGLGAAGLLAIGWALR